MCGRYQFTTGSDDMSAAIVDMLDRRYPGEYKTGEIFPGDANASMIETHDRMPIIIGREAVRPYLTDYETAIELISAASPMLSREPA